MKIGTALTVLRRIGHLPAARRLRVRFEARAGGCRGARAPPAPPPPTLYDAEAFFATTSYIMPAGYAWSADDKQLLVSSDETGIYNVYALPAAGEGKQPLTSSTADSTFAVSWFPADGRVLFTADGGGNEINHLYVREADGKTRDLTPGDKSKAEFFGWSADKQHFFVTTNERNPQAFDLYRYAAKDYSRTLVFKNDAAWQLAEVSPDDRYLALVKPRTSADSDVYLLDLDREEARAAADHQARRQRDARRVLVQSRQQAARVRHRRVRRIQPGLDVRHRQRRAHAAHPRGLGHLVRRVLRVRPLSHLGRQRGCAHRRAHPRQHQPARRSRCRTCRRAIWRRFASRATRRASRCW